MVAISSLTVGLGSVSASTEKGYSITSFEYVTVDEKTVDSFNKLDAPSKEDIKITFSSTETKSKWRLVILWIFEQRKFRVFY